MNIATVLQPQSVELHGWLSSYSEERSIGTLLYRYDIGDIEWGVDAYIAVADCSLIGKKGTMTYVETGIELDVQVFDCSGADGVDENGVSYLTLGGYAGELDYASALAYGHGKVDIVIHRQPPEVNIVDFGQQ